MGAPGLLLAASLLAAAFVEVWETTTASELSLEIDALRVEVRDREARLALQASRASQAAQRTELHEAAAALELRPADPEQIVVIPERLVAMHAEHELPVDGVEAVSRKMASLFVSEARARD